MDADDGTLHPSERRISAVRHSAGFARVLREGVQLLERLVYSWNLPLLPAEMGVSHDALLVDDEEPGPLAERYHRALDVVLAEDLAVGVRQAGEWNVVRLEVALGVLEAVRGNSEQLCAALFELAVPVPQLREMLSAERSHEPAQEDEDDRLPAQLGERHLLAVDGGQSEVGRRSADGYRFRIDSHGASDDRWPPRARQFSPYFVPRKFHFALSSS
jgi:hypothetical protein